MLEYKPQEELIALIKRQEDAIKARDEENSSLLTTLKDLQSRMGGLIKEKAEAAPCKPAETVDLPPFFHAQLDIVCHEYAGMGETTGAYRTAVKFLADDVRFHTARAVAAAKQEGWDSCALANQELVRQLRDQIAAQPVAGELPPLPAGYSVTRVEGHGWYVDPPNGGRWVAYEGTPAADFIAALRQPVQQPAAVLNNDGVKPIGATCCPLSGRKFWGNIDHPELGAIATYGGPFDTYSIPYLDEDDELRVERFDQDMGGWVEGGEPYGWFYAEQQPEFTAPVPAAGVQGDAFPERDQSKPAEQQGVFRKFDVRRVDGSDAPGGKHHGCRYFVLDMGHDQHAAPALSAYAASCAATHPALSAELAAEFGQPDSGRDAALDDSTLQKIIEAVGQARNQRLSPTGTLLLVRRIALAAHPANGAQAGLSDAEIVAALHSLGVDTYPSKFGFSTLQVSATSVPTIRQLVELLAAPQKKE